LVLAGNGETDKTDMMKPSPQLLSCIIISVASLSNVGCALTKDRVDIGYTPMANAPKVSGGGSVSVTASDQRPDKSRVGVKKNGYGMEMAPIESKRAVSDYVQNAIEAELKNRGFRIGEGRRVNVSIRRFANDFKMGFFAGDAVAELEMEVTVPGTGFSKRIDSRGKEEGIQLASGHNAQVALEDALRKGLQQLFADAAFLRALR
jgi:uncharacterized lipoprotein YajG